nr:ribonuclease [Pelomonas sp. KK5]
MQAKESKRLEPGLETVALSDLPREAQTTYRLILAGGPFPHRQDGVVFGNRERILPVKARGWYHEYTVKTPGSRDRGARRMVCGGNPATRPDICFYTDDHYASFKQVR